MDGAPPKDEVGVVVVTYNSGGKVGACLHSLARDLEQGVSVVVVDNHSHDDSVDVARAFSSRVSVVECESNRGFAAACNLGASLSGGRYIVLLNPDVEVTFGWLDPLVRALESNPRMAMVSATTLSPGAPLPPPLHVTRLVGAVPACALLIRRSAWEDLGGLDETIFLYWEDTDLCWRAAQRGYTIGENLESFVHHERGGSSGRRSDVTVVALTSELYVLLKSGPPRTIPLGVLRVAAKTLVTCLRSRALEPLSAWVWNAGHLRSTLSARRRLARARVVPWSEIRCLRRSHLARSREEARARRTGTRSASG